MRCCCCCCGGGGGGGGGGGVIFVLFMANGALFVVGVMNCCCIGMAPVEFGMPGLYGDDEYGV